MARGGWRNKGRQATSHLTVNGWVRVVRTVYWSSGRGSSVPVDHWLGIIDQTYSPGVRELCCREASSGSFRRAADDLARVGQIALTHETLRRIVEGQGIRAAQAQRCGQLKPDWSSADCRVEGRATTCLITGADGVKIPLVTEAEKTKRRSLRRRGGRRGLRRRGRIRRGSDQAYKEFKIVAFYDPSKLHQYAAGISGDHQALGALMRRVAGWLKLDEAETAYSVSDGAEWIRRQYNQRLPMLEANVLDYYHLRDHVIGASHQVFGQDTPEAVAWREAMMGVVLTEGALALLDQVGQLGRSLRARSKREALDKLRGYVAKRVAMLDYPAFLQKGYDIGSGPTEAFCKTLTRRLKGPGMRWDKPNAEGIMALAALRSSSLWNRYWSDQRQAAA